MRHVLLLGLALVGCRERTPAATPIETASPAVPTETAPATATPTAASRAPSKEGSPPSMGPRCEKQERESHWGESYFALVSDAGTDGSSKMRFGAIQVTGAVLPEDVLGVVRANATPIMSCHERALRAEPKIREAVTLKWIIDRNGAVSTVDDATSGEHHLDLACCVAFRVSAIEFPKSPQGITTVVQTIHFEPARSEAEPAPKR